MTTNLQTPFEKNLGIMSPAEWEKILQTRILLIGLGGLGGYVANSLVRLGVHSLRLVDFDRFDSSNLNRQLFSSRLTMGQYKVDVVLDELRHIHPNLDLLGYRNTIQTMDPSVFAKTDIIIDAVDDIPTKLFLESMGTIHQKPVLHGAIGGWFGQVGILMPGSTLLRELYQNASSGAEKSLGSPTFTPAVIANMMVGELVKFVLGRSSALIDRILMVDLLHHDYRVIPIKNGAEAK